jgi:hypothetical protein
MLRRLEAGVAKQTTSATRGSSSQKTCFCSRVNSAPVTASPRPTSCAARSPAMSPCRGSDPDSCGRWSRQPGHGRAVRAGAAPDLVQHAPGPGRYRCESVDRGRRLLEISVAGVDRLLFHELAPRQPYRPAVRVTAPVLRVYWWAIAILTRSSAGMRWSWLSPPISICTQLISPVNLLPVGP